MNPFFCALLFVLQFTIVNLVITKHNLQMLIQERLLLVLKMHNLTPSLFADKIGVQRSSISHVLSGRNKPGLDFLEKIVLAFPRVNAHWLITGEIPLVAEGQIVQEEVPTKEKQLELSQEGVNNDKVVKIVIFYEDGSFDVSYPKKSLNAE